MPACADEAQHRPPSGWRTRASRGSSSGARAAPGGRSANSTRDSRRPPAAASTSTGERVDVLEEIRVHAAEHAGIGHPEGERTGAGTEPHRHHEEQRPEELRHGAERPERPARGEVGGEEKRGHGTVPRGERSWPEQGGRREDAQRERRGGSPAWSRRCRWPGCAPPRRRPPRGSQATGPAGTSPGAAGPGPRAPADRRARAGRSPPPTTLQARNAPRSSSCTDHRARGVRASACAGEGIRPTPLPVSCAVSPVTRADRAASSIAGVTCAAGRSNSSRPAPSPTTRGK